MNEKMVAARAKLQADNRAIKDHDWLAKHGKKIPQMGVDTPVQSSSADGLTVGVTCDAYRQAGEDTTAAQSGTSIFDPVLCEIAYRWFCPQGGAVLDPFAGGSVRGVVAVKLGRQYVGVDLRPEQAAANEEQAAYLTPDGPPTWVVGDSVDVLDLAPGEYDLVFSCPPYFDLETYSTDDRDLSTMTYEGFLAVYGDIIAKSCSMLRDDRFACFVVGDIRDKRGMYRGFVGDTIAAFRAAGLELYNEMVLVTSVGSLPIRVGRQFDGYRKVGKTHQNVLVFVKGDPGRAAAACGKVDTTDIEMPPAQDAESLALALGDLDGLDAAELAVGDVLDGLAAVGDEALLLDCPTEVAALACGVLRSRARAAGLPAVRVWVSRDGGWEKLPDDADLCFVAGGAAYLNQDLFKTARRPDTGGPDVEAV